MKESDIRRSFVTVVAGLSLLAITACEGGLFSPKQGWMHAEITVLAQDQVGPATDLHETITFEGKGWFDQGGNARMGVRRNFSINAISGGNVTGGAQVGFFIETSRIPAPGHHDIAPPPPGGNPATAFMATYIDGGALGWFAAKEGTLEITSSSARVVRGRFSFVAVKYCEAGDDNLLPCHPGLVDYSDETLERVRIEGSFQAVPGGMDATIPRLLAN